MLPGNPAPYGAAPGPWTEPLDEEDSAIFFLNFAATIIQRHFRGYMARKAHAAQKKARAAELAAETAAHLDFMRRDTAARLIQSVWQGYRNKRIYQYYRDIIQFRERGDPRDMLRSINPREVELMDAAAGVHVRFRLGGDMFPPLVFYKVFTHRTVTDINAFGPRNYAAEQLMPAKQLHSKLPHKKAMKKTFTSFEIHDSLRTYIKPDGTQGLRSTVGWYERVDNNGWRPIAERLLVDEDPVTYATRTRPVGGFHHNPVIRREERLRRAKQKRREWLRKAYAQAPGMDASTLEQLDATLASGDALDDEYLDDLQAEVEGLLDWSRHLDFQSYVGDWVGTACTLGSEALMPTYDSRPSAQLPAPDLSLHAAMAAAGVPLPPFKGGVTAACGTTGGLVTRC